MELPEFSEDSRNLVLLARRAGYPLDFAARAASVDPEMVEEWRDQGAKDRSKDKATEAAQFHRDLEKAETAGERAEVIAAGVVDQERRTNPEAAAKWLRELSAQRRIERVRELTTY